MEMANLENRELTPDQTQTANEIKWMQSLRFGSYITVGGSTLASQESKGEYLPTSMKGLKVLDIGAAEGYFSFICEARGAERIVAIDKPKTWRKAYGQRGFDLAANIYNSKVEYHEMDVVDIHQLNETFDIILFLGTYYHINDPILALRRISECLKPGGVVYIEGTISPHRGAKLHYFDPTYCIATIPFFKMMGEHFGFSRIELLMGTWQVAYRYQLFRKNGRSILSSAARTIAIRLAWMMLIMMPLYHRGLLLLEKAK